MGSTLSVRAVSGPSRAIGRSAQRPFDALVVDGLPVILAFCVLGQESLDAVAGPLGGFGLVRARTQASGPGRVRQVVRRFASGMLVWVVGRARQRDLLRHTDVSSATPTT